MVELEPGLQDLYAEILNERDVGRSYFCANEVWARKYKPRMKKIVGWYAGHPNLPRKEREAPVKISELADEMKGYLDELRGMPPVDERLRTENAYHIAYDKLYGSLPDCRNCACIPKDTFE